MEQHLINKTVLINCDQDCLFENYIILSKTEITLTLPKYVFGCHTNTSDITNFS